MDNIIVPSNVEIIVGTYEEFLLGYKVYKDKTLKQSFADKSHSGAVKCLAVQGHWIASGGTDDRVFVYDMRTRKQSEIILSHSGTVNTLAFTPLETHLLSGGEDGRLIATRTTNWTRDGLWEKAHNGLPVKHVCCHNSGKLALSLGGDLVLRTWNLVKGRLAYKTNLKSRASLANMPECLVWSQNCEFFSLCGPRIIEIWSIKTANILRSHELTAKPTCLVWINDSVCLVGLEDGNIFWFPLKESSNKARILKVHTARVKAICHKDNILVTVSSAGELKVWQIRFDAEKFKEIATTNIGCRPTCIGLLDLNQFGEDYILNRSSIKGEKNQPAFDRAKPIMEIPRSVVTIEYETIVTPNSRHKDKSCDDDDSKNDRINDMSDNNLDESYQDNNEGTIDDDQEIDKEDLESDNEDQESDNEDQESDNENQWNDEDEKEEMKQIETSSENMKSNDIERNNSSKKISTEYPEKMTLLLNSKKNKAKRKKNEKEDPSKKIKQCLQCQ